jgi:small nuclear ribonucleoprotein (snRNP)-like protein
MINDSCSLVLQDLYLYDFKSAYPRILESIDWDFKDIDLDDKSSRNISIGLAQRNNENLSSFLMNTVGNLLQFYLSENNIDEKNVIVTQRDGFILNTFLRNTDEFMKLDLREHIELMVISPDRKKYLSTSNKGVTVKGLQNKYDALDDVYKEFGKLNLYNKTVLFKQLSRLKELVLNNKNKRFYMVEVNDKLAVITKKHGTLVVSNEHVFNLQDVDSMKYYDHYFREFMEAIFLEFY